MQCFLLPRKEITNTFGVEGKSVLPMLEEYLRFFEFRTIRSITKSGFW